MHKEIVAAIHKLEGVGVSTHTEPTQQPGTAMKSLSAPAEGWLITRN